MHAKRFPLISRDKRFYQGFFHILIIISLQHLATLAVNLVDNMMLGRYTELALSGATLVNQYQFILQNLASGVGMGIEVLAGQYWGKKQLEPIRRIIGIGIKLSLLVGLAFFTAAVFAPAGMLGLLTNDAAIIEEGVRYLEIMRITYPIYALSSALMFSLQTVETVMIGTVMSLSTVCINICLNYCLIYGNFGFPELGVAGAAIATLISRTVELIIILVYVLKIDRKLHMKVRDLLRLDTTYLRDFFRVATPMIVSGFFWGITQSVQTAILGHLTAPAIAANSICTTVINITAVVGMACASAASITMAKSIGAFGLRRVREYAVTLQLIFLGIGILTGLVTFFSRDFVLGFYAAGLSPETYALARQFLTIMSVAVVCSCYQYPTSAGIVAGGGDTKYPPIMENLFAWLWVIPMSALCAFVFDLPPVIVFIVLKSDQVLKCIPNFIKCNRFRWARELTR
ncbi:MAG: MATE family efflux transporter [Butyricicoccus sp.]|nr:MATE family efflux transporter [Butyricicoccus sp.]